MTSARKFSRGDFEAFCGEAKRVCGRHEALELLMAEVGTLLGNFVSKRMVEEQVHDVIRRLEKVI